MSERVGVAGRWPALASDQGRGPPVRDPTETYGDPKYGGELRDIVA